MLKIHITLNDIGLILGMAHANSIVGAVMRVNTVANDLATGLALPLPGIHDKGTLVIAIVE